MNSDQILSLARTLLTLAGGLAVAFGVVDASTSSVLQGDVLTAVGAVLTAATAIWGAWAHSHPQQVQAAARSIAAMPDATSVAPVAMALVKVGADVDTSNLPPDKP